MPRKDSSNLKRVLLLLLISGIFWTHCGAQVSREEAHRPPDGSGGDGSAFFALRSCHQLLQGDSGEFFSPDYLCSNPPLWCNWTIQVDPGKRIHLHLEDLTTDDTCHLRQDQIHVDEPTGHLVGHKVLQKCWREAKYTSSSNALYVVLLIGGWPTPMYRGFYGRYQAFGPPVVYNPREGVTDASRETEPPGLSGPVTNAEQIESADPDLTYDYYDQHVAMTAALGPEVDQNLHQSSENYSRAYQFTAVPTVPASTQRTSRTGRGVTRTHSSQSDSAVYPTSPRQQGGSQPDERSTRASTAIQRNAMDAAGTEHEGSTRSPAEGNAAAGAEPAADAENRMEVGEASNELPSPSEGPELHPHPNVVEPLSDHRGNLHMRNHSEIPHPPGDHLFEVAVEVNFSHDLEESWDDLAKLLLQSVKALMSKQLAALHTQLSISSKRLKRLHAGALYILWLRIGQGPGGPQVHRAVHAAMQSLIATGVGLRGNHRKAFIMSVSTADVNECGTHLVLCDVNADCVNQFGTYSCRCRPGFQDESRLGSGGAVCLDMNAAGCSSGLSAETKGVYVLFFLLSSLILIMLAVAGMLYHRHHRGAFLVRCHSSGSISPPDINNNHHHHLHHDDSYSTPADSDLPPPPLPARGPREGWAHVKDHCPAVDLPLLRFSPLCPADSYMEPQEGVKM